MTAQIGDSFIYDGNAYVIVAESLGKELFSPSEYGLKPTPFSTACRNGYWCNYEISDALYLQNLFIHCSNGKYPDINGKSVNIPPKYDRKKQAVESLLFGDNGYRIYGNLNLKILYTGKILVGSGFIHRYYIHVGYQRAIAYKKLLEFEFEEGRLKNIEDLSKKAREKRKKMEEMYRNNLGTPPNKFSTTDQGFSGVQEEHSSATSGIRTRKRYKIFSDHSDISKESTF